MYACMHVCIYVYIYAVCICIYICMYACMHLCIYMCIYVSMHVCMHVCMYVCMYVCLYVCIQSLNLNLLIINLPQRINAIEPDPTRGSSRPNAISGLSPIYHLCRNNTYLTQFDLPNNPQRCIQEIKLLIIIKNV